MARTATLAELRLRTQQRADIEGSTYIPPAEVDGLVNMSLCELFDLLRTAYPERYQLTQSIVTTAGQSTYAVTAGHGWSLSVRVVDPVARRINEIEPHETDYFDLFTGAAGISIEHKYVPAPTKLVADGDIFDGVAGYEEIIVVGAALRARQKGRRDTADLERDFERLTEKIANAAQDRLLLATRTVRNIDDEQNGWGSPWGWGWNDSRIGGYQLIGDNLILYVPRVWR